MFKVPRPRLFFNEQRHWCLDNGERARYEVGFLGCSLQARVGRGRAHAVCMRAKVEGMTVGDEGTWAGVEVCRTKTSSFVSETSVCGPGSRVCRTGTRSCVSGTRVCVSNSNGSIYSLVVLPPGLVLWSVAGEKLSRKGALEATYGRRLGR